MATCKVCLIYRGPAKPVKNGEHVDPELGLTPATGTCKVCGRHVLSQALHFNKFQSGACPKLLLYAYRNACFMLILC